MQDDADEQAVYCLSRILAGAEHRYPMVERVPSSRVRNPENAILLGWPEHTCYISNESYPGIHDAVRIVEFCAWQDGRFSCLNTIFTLCRKELSNDRRFATSWLVTYLIGRPTYWKTCQMKLTRSIQPLDQKSSNCFLTERSGQMRKGRSSQEYNVLLIGLDFVAKVGVKYLEAYGDSKLIIN